MHLKCNRINYSQLSLFSSSLNPSNEGRGWKGGKGREMKAMNGD
jgi:hypothetical protein